MISSCSLVGSHVWASTLRHMGHAFDLVYGDPDAPATQTRLREAVRTAATVRRLRSVRLGMVGGHAPGFFAMSAEPFSLHRGLGVQLQSYSLLEFSDVVNGVAAAAVDEDVERVKALRIPHKDTSDDDLPQASRLYLAMRAYLDHDGLDALTVRCWPEMPNTFGQWPYLGIARLANEGRAVVCEGDADGALSAWVGESLGFGRCYITDWLEHEGQDITLWHGGAAPMDLSPPPGEPGGPRIARHFNIRKPAVVEATLEADKPVTIFRLWRSEGRYRLTARDAQTVKPKRHLMGTNGTARLLAADPAAWFEELCHEGMPHHVVVFPGHHAGPLRRFARVMGMKFV
jgi:L-fucose isomerase-like protein